MLSKRSARRRRLGSIASATGSALRALWAASAAARWLSRPRCSSFSSHSRPRMRRKMRLTKTASLCISSHASGVRRGGTSRVSAFSFCVGSHAMSCVKPISSCIARKSERCSLRHMGRGAVRQGAASAAQRKPAAACASTRFASPCEASHRPGHDSLARGREPRTRGPGCGGTHARDARSRRARRARFVDPKRSDLARTPRCGRKFAASFELHHGG